MFQLYLITFDFLSPLRSKNFAVFNLFIVKRIGFYRFMFLLKVKFVKVNLSILNFDLVIYLGLSDNFMELVYQKMGN